MACIYMDNNSSPFIFIHSSFGSIVFSQNSKDIDATYFCFPSRDSRALQFAFVDKVIAASPTHSSSIYRLFAVIESAPKEIFQQSEFSRVF